MKQIRQTVIDQFILQTGNEVKRATLSKDIRNLKAFVNWYCRNLYLNVNIKLKELKQEERPVRSLNNIQIKNLLEASKQYPAIKIRILLALDTGLRRGDIDSLKINDIDFERNVIAAGSRKTRKSVASRPVLVEVIKEISKYVCSLNVGEEKIV